MAYSPGTWRRLKIAVEARSGRNVPPLPEPDLVRLLGLLAGIRDGAGAATVGDEAEQERRGREERARIPGEALASACRRIAQAVDVGPFL